jgi:hypothetical protein
MLVYRPLKFLLSICCFCIQAVCFAQDNQVLNYNEGGVPTASFFVLEGDSLYPLKYLKSAQVNTIIVKVQGGMDHVIYNQILSSREAIVEKSEEDRNMYYVTPIGDDDCELIVDVKLMEIYYYVRFEKEGKKQVKKIIQTYTPRTYMIGYEKFEVIE